MNQPKNQDKGPLTVLVVDDQFLVRDVCRAMLAAGGAHSICVGSGAEALEVYERRSEEIDVVLLDLKMPRMCGRETAYQLRRLDSSVPLLITSGFSEEPMPDPTISGPYDFLPKPFNPTRLMDALRSAMRRQVRAMTA